MIGTERSLECAGTQDFAARVRWHLALQGNSTELQTFWRILERWQILFSSNALNDAKELADIYYKSGYEDVEAKASKCYTRFLPTAYWKDQRLNGTYESNKTLNSLLKKLNNKSKPCSRNLVLYWPWWASNNIARAPWSAWLQKLLPLPIVIISYGYIRHTDILAHVKSNLCYLICSRHLIS